MGAFDTGTNNFDAGFSTGLDEGGLSGGGGLADDGFGVAGGLDGGFGGDSTNDGAFDGGFGFGGGDSTAFF